jgi:hypothetical protein
VSQVWTAQSGTVACRIDPIGTSNQGRVTGGAIDERSTHVVTIPAGGTVLDAGNRFAIAGRGTFEVTALRVRSAEWATEFEVVAT